MPVKVIREEINKNIAVVVLSLVCMWFAACAGHIPGEKIEEAEKVLQSAFNAEAPVYAPEEYARAQESFYLSKMEMDKRRYKKAQALLDSATKDGQLALTKAKAGKTIQQAQEQLYGSDLAQLKKYITDVCSIAEKSLVKAESAFESRNYVVARQHAELSLQLSQEIPKLLEEKMQEEPPPPNAAELEKAAKQAQTLLEKAQLEAANIIADAKRKAEAITVRALEKMFPTSYTVRSGDKMNIIAARREIYNDSYQWPLIYKANRDQIRDPHILFVGQQLVIPRKVSIEEVREACRQAGAPEPFDPPPDAFHPSDYQ